MFEEYADLAELLAIVRNTGRELGTTLDTTFATDTITVEVSDPIFRTGAFVAALEGDDSIRGTNADDNMAGNEGDDFLDGRGGNDLIFGGLGDDFLRGSVGIDTLVGDAGDDSLVGMGDRDILVGRDGDDRLFGGDGNDRIVPGAGDNFVNGGEGTDALVLAGLLSDYTFETRPSGAIVVTAKDGSGRTVAVDVELLRDDTGAAVDATSPTTTLQLLHATDLEGNADAVESAPNFATVVDALEENYDTTLVISSGDNFIPSPFSNAAGSADPAVQAQLNAVLDSVFSTLEGETYANLQTEAGRFDIAIMNAIGFDASALGNHEFDFNQEQLLDIIAAQDGGTPGDVADDTWIGAAFPYLSANLSFGPESVLRSVLQEDGVAANEDGAGTVAPFAVLEENGERFGVIGATTQLVEQISSTFGDPDNANDDVTALGTVDMAALAAEIQPIIDQLEADGVNKIILTSHLQQFSLEEELATLLDGVDIIIAGGSDTLLADGEDRLREDDEADGPYPVLTEDAGGDPVAIVSTDGQYTYVGQLVVEFDAGGTIIPGSIDPAVSGAFATDEEGVLAVTGESDLDTAITNSTRGAAVRDLVTVIQEAVLETSGNNFFADQAVDLNGERNPGVRSEETNLGNLTADANLAVAEELSGEEVLVSIKNGGGIRASIPVGDGLISELEIQQVLAFNNTLTLITLTPDQLYETLSFAVSGTTYDSSGVATDVDGRFPQVGGVRFSFDPSLPADRQVRDVILEGAGPGGADVQIFDDGVATPEAADFSDGIRVVTLSFLAGGGDGYPFADFAAADAAFADVQSLFQPDIIADGEARFTNVGSEQDALAEFLADNFPVDADPANDFAEADTPAAQDTRIVNLAVPGTSDIDLLP